MEKLDILLEDGAKSGIVKERHQVHREGALHGVVRIYITRLREGQLDFLMQKRSGSKASYPGYYDAACAGHVAAGDCAVYTAMRELEEELGIRASADDFTFLFCQNNNWLETSGEKEFWDYERDTIFWYHRPVNVEDLILQQEEVESITWYHARDIEDWVKQKDNRVSFTLEEFSKVRNSIRSLREDRRTKKES